MLSPVIPLTFCIFFFIILPPTTTAIAPLSCIDLTLSINEQLPLSTNAIQLSQGGVITSQPYRNSSEDGATKYPPNPSSVSGIRGPKAAIRSIYVSFVA